MYPCRMGASKEAPVLVLHGKALVNYCLAPAPCKAGLSVCPEHLLSESLHYSWYAPAWLLTFD